MMVACVILAHPRVNAKLGWGLQTSLNVDSREFLKEKKEPNNAGFSH